MPDNIPRKLRVEYPGAMYHIMAGETNERTRGFEWTGCSGNRGLSRTARLGWGQADLALRRKSEPAKLALAARLRNETTLSIKAIAARLHLGKAKGAKTNLHKWMRGNVPQEAAQGTLGI